MIAFETRRIHERCKESQFYYKNHDSILSLLDIYYDFLYMNLRLVGQQIRLHRQKLGLTQRELASRIDVSWEMVSRYERGVSSPLGRIDPLTTALKTTPAELLQDSFNSSTLRDRSATVRVPLHVTIPRNLDFGSEIARYFYSAPEWVMRVDKDVFLIEPKIIRIKTTQIREGGPIYISPNTQPDSGDLLLYSLGKELFIDLFTRIPKDSKIIGTVLAQELRFKG